MAETPGRAHPYPNPTRSAGKGHILTSDQIAGWESRRLITSEQASAIRRVRQLDRGEDVATLADLVTAGLITRAQAVTIRASDGIVDTPPEPMAPMPRVLEPEVSDATRRPEPPNPAAPTTAPNGLTASLAAVQASRLDQRRLGLMLAVLALVGLATDLLGVTTDVFIAPWRLAGADAGDAIHATASVIALLGASQMVRGITGGRRLVGLSLAANIGASLVWDRLADPLTLMVIGGWVALLYVVTRRL